MDPQADRTCKRCSVARVNALIKAYDRAHGQGSPARLHDLRRIIQLCGQRGFPEGAELLRPGLDRRQLRALCWNVSSFLEDSDLKTILGSDF